MLKTLTTLAFSMIFNIEAASISKNFKSKQELMSFIKKQYRTNSINIFENASSSSAQGLENQELLVSGTVQNYPPIRIPGLSTQIPIPPVKYYIKKAATGNRISYIAEFWFNTKEESTTSPYYAGEI